MAAVLRFPLLRSFLVFCCLASLPVGCGKSDGPNRTKGEDSLSRDTGASLPPSDSVPAASASEDSMTVTLFMVEPAPDPQGAEAFGCGDMLVGESYRIARKNNLLAEAIRALIAPNNDTPRNYVAGEGIRLDSAIVENGTARIYLGGHFVIGGVCDHPRIEGQLRKTAMQFPDVRSVEVYVGSETLTEYLSLK